ncbi:polysaccharide deacetylase family protein [Streptomyces sp. AV19]|uniref:polysaccharide deacetylase family protein n=1 Tax=Streptomyces sp. AV19 TaxID=2793068 RepID=UPI0018FEAE4B|nr:polysaccharide deacetylase family protein [Streptomyces sp. AV19]MBH1938093.1 polysaccharide deacetylase family protein [Streptomyces sp. AV19]MDG4533886.1 polysaccharide deacetylase family protein [Streptomyces sp. AV19]
MPKQRRPILLALAALLVPAPAHAGEQRLPPVVPRIETDDPVVFVTIDDGWHRDPDAARILLDRRVPATLFLLPDAVAQDTGYFRALVTRGRAAVPGNHTLSHPDLTTLDGAGQRKEICGARDRLTALFGRPPGLLRPPYGAYDDATRASVRRCGVRQLVTWTHDFTTWGDAPPPVPQLRPGDIVLLHFTPTLAGDLTRALDAARAAGLTPAPLGRYLRR